MSLPVIVGLLALLIVAVLATTMIRGRGTRTTATGRQSGLIVLALVVVAGLVLYVGFVRR